MISVSCREFVGAKSLQTYEQGEVPESLVP